MVALVVLHQVGNGSIGVLHQVHNGSVQAYPDPMCAR